MTDVPMLDALGALTERGQPGQRERGVPAVVAPRLEVVGDHDAVEPDLLGLDGEVDQVARGELLGGGLVPDAQRHGPTVCRRLADRAGPSPPPSSPTRGRLGTCRPHRDPLTVEECRVVDAVDVDALLGGPRRPRRVRPRSAGAPARWRSSAGAPDACATWGSTSSEWDVDLDGRGGPPRLPGHGGRPRRARRGGRHVGNGRGELRRAGAGALRPHGRRPGRGPRPMAERPVPASHVTDGIGSGSRHVRHARRGRRRAGRCPRPEDRPA